MPFAVEKVVPLSEERVKKMAKWPGLLSTQTTLMLPPPSRAIIGAVELPVEFLERFSCGVEKVAPLSAERLKETWARVLKSFSQTTLMLPVASTAICGFAESEGSLEILTGVEKVTPPSVERLKKMV